jgi:hypothetical protein
MFLLDSCRSLIPPIDRAPFPVLLKAGKGDGGLLARGKIDK